MKTIRIGDGKYVVVITDEDGVVDVSMMDGFTSNLRDWWASGEKFYVCSEVGKVKIRFERMEEEEIK